MTWLDPMGSRRWMRIGPPWARPSSPWTHAWIPQRDRIVNPGSNGAGTVDVRDSVGSDTLTNFGGSTLAGSNTFNGRRLQFIDTAATGAHFMYADGAATAISGNAQPWTAVLLAHLQSPAAATQSNIISFGSSTSAVKFCWAAFTGNTNPVTIFFRRENDAASIKDISWSSNPLVPHIWTFQYNGASSFVREDRVQVASGDLGVGQCTLDTFAIGGWRAIVTAGGVQVRAPACLLSNTAVSLTEILYAENYLSRQAGFIG